MNKQSTPSLSNTPQIVAMEISLLSFFSLILLSSYPLLLSAAPSNLDQLCSMLGGWYVTPQLCHSVLDSDPRSRTADLNGLGIIACDVAARNATSVAADIQLLLSNASSSDTNREKVLKTCLKLYADVVPALNGVAESIKGKNYSAAETVLDAAMKVPANCDDAATDDTELWGLLNHYDTGFTYVVWVTRAIAAYIERYGGN